MQGNNVGIARNSHLWDEGKEEYMIQKVDISAKVRKEGEKRQSIWEGIDQ